MAKIAVVDKFCNTEYKFSGSLVQHLKTIGHEVISTDAFTDSLFSCDSIHFDWADEVTCAGINSIIKNESSPRITVRVHAYELHDGLASRIPWEKVDALIFVSKHYQNIFNSLKIRAPKSQHVIQHGIDSSRFGRVNHTGNNILFVGSINFKKGPQLLAQVALEFPDREVHVFGDIQCHRSKVYFNHLKIPNLKFFPRRKHIEKVMQDPQYGYNP